MNMLENGENYITVNGIQHWYKIGGVQQHTIPIVIVHGGPGGNHYVFERTIGPKLEEFATIIYYEQRGCGRSSAPSYPTAYSIPLLIDDLEQLRKALHIPTFHLLGYSFGGQLCLEYALAYPNRVATLLLQAPSTGNYEDMYRMQLAAFERIATGEIKEKIQHIQELPLPLKEKYDMIWTVIDTETVDRFLFQNIGYAQRNRALWEESGLQNTGLMAKALFRSRLPIPLKERVSSLTVPALFLVGKHDRNTGVFMSEQLATRIQNASMKIFENSAHFPDIEETEAYANEVQRFLQLL